MTSLNKKIIVFAPHPDDETLGCGGTIIKKLGENYDPTIVILTDGRHAFSCRGILSDPTPEEVKRIRKQEAIKAAEVLGVPSDNLRFWDFEDLELSKNIEEVQKKCMEILRELQPCELYFPYEKDCNPDHKATSNVLKACLTRVGFSTTCYQYSIAQRFMHLGPFTDKIANLLKHNLFFVDVTEFIVQKTIAINIYESQKEVFSRGMIKTKPTLSNSKRFLGNNEVFICNKKINAKKS